jgi:hypothetical protein
MKKDYLKSLGFWIPISFCFFTSFFAIIAMMQYIYSKDASIKINEKILIMVVVLSVLTIISVIGSIIAYFRIDKDNRDKFHAKMAFFISLWAWIPLFNFGICIVSIWISILSLKLQRKQPEKYAGLGYVVVALVISVGALLLTIIGLIFYLFFSQQVCTSPICTSVTNPLALNQ